MTSSSRAFCKSEMAKQDLPSLLLLLCSRPRHDRPSLVSCLANKYTVEVKFDQNKKRYSLQQSVFHLSLLPCHANILSARIQLILLSS